MKKKNLLPVLVSVVVVLVSSSSLLVDEEGKALKSIKASFSKDANVLLDWDEIRNDDYYCSWRGVSCDNISRFSVVSFFFGNPLLCGGWFGSPCGTLYGLESKGLMSRTAAVVCIALGCITLLSIVVVAIYISNLLMKGSDKMIVQGPPKLIILQMDMAMHSYQDIMRITENMSKKHIIGYGVLSTVYKCVLRNSKPIAIKWLYTQYPCELAWLLPRSHPTEASFSMITCQMVHYGIFSFMTEVKLDWDTKNSWSCLRLGLSFTTIAFLALFTEMSSPQILYWMNFDAHLSDFGIIRGMQSRNLKDVHQNLIFEDFTTL